MPRLLVAGLQAIYSLTGWRPTDETLCTLGRSVPGLRDVPVQMRNGCWLCLDLSNPVSVPYLFEHQFPCEKIETELVARIVRPGDVAVDVGANVGWYSSLLCRLVGAYGQVHAFEPNRYLVRLLQHLSRQHPQLRVHAAALGEFEEWADFHIPANWISGSLVSGDTSDQKQRTRVVRLDVFLSLNGVKCVDFVKLDAEGAERHVLEGAGNILDSVTAPIWLVEMSSRETRRFGYHPSRLVEKFASASRVTYHAYAIDQTAPRLLPLEIPREDVFWFNALFVPTSRRDRLPLDWLVE